MRTFRFCYYFDIILSVIQLPPVYIAALFAPISALAILAYPPCAVGWSITGIA